MIYQYDKDKIKEELTIEQVRSLLEDLGGEPIPQPNQLVCKTICHCGDSHKLYYYENTHLFHCYTGCADSTFDIFELVKKIKERENKNYQLPQAIEYIASYFGYSQVGFCDFDNQLLIAKDINYIENLNRIKNIEIDSQRVELKEYENKILKHLPHPIILPWIKDNITKGIMDQYEICYDPKSCGVIIPHQDIKGRLVGIRERELVQENIDRYGKYHPAKIGGRMYNHPLSFNLYGLYQNQENIKRIQTAFVFESEKSVLQYGSMFGQENNLAVAVCGSSFINYQFWLLEELGVKEIVVGLDKQFQKTGDQEFKKLTKNLKNIHKKYGKYIKISIIFDKWNLLDYKDSPTDKGKETFLELYKRRINLY